jgi:hypothetical protein
LTVVLGPEYRAEVERAARDLAPKAAGHGRGRAGAPACRPLRASR